QARSHRPPWSLDELVLGQAGAVESGKHQIGIPAGALPGGWVGVVDREGLDQPETQAVLGIAGVRAVTADVRGRVDPVGEGLGRRAGGGDAGSSRGGDLAW